MSKRYFITFSTISMVHLMILLVSWKITQTETFRAEVQKLGTGAIELQMAGAVISAPEKPAVIQRKAQKEISKTAKTISPAVQNSAPNVSGASENSVSFGTSQGSVFGTARQGLTDPKSIYKAEVRAMIEKHKFYPPMSKRLGQTGTVIVAFTLLEDGNISDLKVAEASRYENLNASALDAVKKVVRFKPIPKEFGESKIEIKVPINFKTI